MQHYCQTHSVQKNIVILLEIIVQQKIMSNSIPQHLSLSLFMGLGFMYLPEISGKVCEQIDTNHFLISLLSVPSPKTFFEKQKEMLCVRHIK
jgi:hypothetical protein